MANLSRSEIIKTKPIGEGLNDFCDLFNLTCQDLGISSSLDSLHQIDDEGLKNLVVDLILALQNLPAAPLLPSSASRGNLLRDGSGLSAHMITQLAASKPHVYIYTGAPWRSWRQIVFLVDGVDLASDPRHANPTRSLHVWDNPITNFVPQRKLLMVNEFLYVLASGLIKISILVFYRRMAFRTITQAFVILNTTCLVLVILFTFIFFFCRPLSAFCDQLNYAKIPWRQKTALGTTFAAGYIVSIICAVKTYFIYHTFFVTYDVTWVTWYTWLLTLLEVLAGIICASVPALKAFFTTYFDLSEAGSSVKKSMTRTKIWRPGVITCCKMRCST
ncbi:hypothetical protein AOQ84DRAFT_368850 [Glonium stellatum]|uniref:Rhodopsin domain-containing protein n=1 Tax=Glonium stellatum TaxID=574774 RepID=A0A8E2JMP2_9PEZI|nr:hypothetical protein AOQ84DRAFT_368850 [Glonium stellatum]